MRLRGRQSQVALARSEGLLIEDVDSEKVIYDTERKQAHCLTPLAAVIFDNCDGETPISDLARRASERLGEPVSEDQVNSALVQLEHCGLLATPIRISRRDMIHKGAALGAAAAAATLIFTVDPPMAHAQGGECSLELCSVKTHCAGLSCPDDEECLCLMGAFHLQCFCED